jgi:hypothetical protein
LSCCRYLDALISETRFNKSAKGIRLEADAESHIPP